MTNTEGPPSTLGRLHTVRSLSNFFGVSERTIRRWCADKLIVGRYKYQGGTCLKLFFTEGAVLRFMDENMPTLEDLDLNHKPQTSEQKIEMIRRVRNMHRAFAGRASAAKVSRLWSEAHGVPHTELDAHETDLQTQDEGPAILDHGSERPWNYRGTESEIPRDRGQDRWDDPDRWEEEDDPYNDGD